jgi:hypothetical protein
MTPSEEGAISNKAFKPQRMEDAMPSDHSVFTAMCTISFS